jgi:hypothetical protein
MYVNIARNKLLINKKHFTKVAKKEEAPARRCNHCGGAIRDSGEMEACIMCARDVNHYCDNCIQGHPSKVSGEKQKSV